MTQDNKTRINTTIDLLKYVMAIAVVIIHTGFMLDNPFINTYISMAVPFFACVSGYYLNLDNKESIKKSIIRFGILILIGSAVFQFCTSVGQYLTGVQLHISLKTIFYNPGVGHLWYLYASIICTIFCFLIRNQIKNHPKVILVIVLIINAFFIYGFAASTTLQNIYASNLILETCLRTGLGFMPFFVLGVLIKQYPTEVENKFGGGQYNKTLILLLIGYIVERTILYSIVKESFYCPLIFMFVLVSLCLKYPNIFNINSNTSKAIRFVSTVVYIIHPVVMYAVEIVFRLTGNYNFPVTLFISTLVGIVLYFLNNLLQLKKS